jgi:hypothetical protein
MKARVIAETIGSPGVVLLLFTLPITSAGTGQACLQINTPGCEEIAGRITHAILNPNQMHAAPINTQKEQFEECR